MNWQNQVGVVTGATSGIGRAIALSFAARGMTVVVIGRDPKRLEELAAQARARTDRVLAYRADLSDDQEIRRVRDEVHMSCGAIDVLVHSIGAFHMASIEATPVMIVFINSSVSLATRANVAAYSATKYALRAIADALRAEVNADGVRVLSVYPGRTATPQQEAIHALEGKPYRPEMLVQPEDVATAVVDALAIARTAEVTDVCIRPLRKT